MSDEENVKGPEGSSDSGVEVKSQQQQQITLIIKEQEGDAVHFKVKPTTKMGKILTAYVARKGVSMESRRFFFDGKTIDSDTTVEKLEMEDGDQIDCFLEQQGGN